MGLFSSSDIGVDLGTAYSLIYVRGKGIVLRQPSVVAVERGSGKMAALGEKAKEGTVTEPAGFAGWKVGAQAASLQEKLVQEALIPAGAEMVVYKSIDDAVLALQTGKIDALAVAHGNGEAIISNNPDIAFTGYDFEVDPKYENNVCLLNKNSTELLQKVNAALAKALAAGVYDGWYNDAKALAGISTASEVSYNDDGSAPSN